MKPVHLLVLGLAAWWLTRTKAAPMGLLNWSSPTALPPAFPTTQDEFDFMLEDPQLW